MICGGSRPLAKRGWGGGGFGLLALPAFLPSVVSFFFLNQNKGGTPDPSPRSVTGLVVDHLHSTAKQLVQDFLLEKLARLEVGTGRKTSQQHHL